MPTEPMTGRRVYYALISILALVAILYFGRDVLLPLAIAVLLTFLLSPVCTWLERRGIWRVVAVLLTLCSVTAGFAVIGWIVGLQMVTLGTRLPDYKDNLIAKLQAIRPSSGGMFAKLRNTVNEVRGAMGGGDGDQAKTEKRPLESEDPRDASDLPPPPPEPKTAATPSIDSDPTLEDGAEELAENIEVITPVRIVPDEAVPFETLRTVLTTIMAPFANVFIIFVLVIFMLLNREDLRNRLVRLAGNRLALTTRTLDEVGQRISRYLLMNGLVNGGFGLCVAIGLKVIGVDYAMTWGLLAAVLRFLPYIGPIIAAVLPVSMAFIQFPGNDWFHPLAALGLILVLELICNNVIEPLAYGHGTGVSTVAILISALFWGWIWGPIGLMLSVPITVVLAVLGTHLTMLEPLGILLGDRPALASWITYYQRLLAGDVDEADSIVHEQRETKPIETVYDEVIVQALVLAERDHESGDLSADQRRFIFASTRELINELGEAATDEANKLTKAAAKQSEATEEANGQADTLRIDNGHTTEANAHGAVLGCTTKDEGDEIALVMLKQLLGDKVTSFDIVGEELLPSDVVARVAADKPDIVVVSSLAPGGGAETRYLCKRLRKHCPNVQIVVGRWGYSRDLDEVVTRMKASGADATVVTLTDGCEAVLRIADQLSNSAISTPEQIAAMA